MTLEVLLADLALTDHMAALSEWRDDLLREKAAEMQAVRLEAESAIAAASEASLAAITAAEERHRAAIAELEAENAALRNPPAPPTQPVLSRLAEAFAALPAEVQAAFAASFAVVRVLVDAGRADLARAHVASLPVPAELEATRQGILGLLAA